MTTNRKAGQVYHSNPNVGVTEKEIVRIAHLLSFGGTLRDVRDLYAKEGWPIDNCSMVYCAAKVYLKIEHISNREFQLQRQNSAPTRREMRAVRVDQE